MSQNSQNKRQLEPKENPECTILVKDSKTSTNQKNTQQNNTCCNCVEVLS